MNRLAIIAFLVLAIIFSSFSTGNKPPKYQIRTIVIDPGHGGHDTGCLGSSSREKNIALAVSLRLGKLIEEYFPEINVIYTRKTDVFIELHERAAIANRNKADLFICIHCNSGPSAAFGAETFVMGLHKSADNLSVAKRENSSILLEKDYKTNYDGFDPNSPEANIIFSLYQNTFMHQSLHFASSVQEQFSKNAGRFNRGVKQAGFLVLFRTAMPSVLIELGFLTNRSDEKFLNSEKGQETMATSILKAFKDYKGDTERRAGGGAIPEKVEASTKNGSLPNSPQSPDDADSRSVTNKSNAQTDPSDSTSTQKKDSVHPQGRIIYTIQVGAVANSAKGDETRYEKVFEVRKIIGDDGMTRFYTGVFDTFEEAKIFLNTLKQKGFNDAFICAFSGARRITVAEAAQLLNN